MADWLTVPTDNQRNAVPVDPNGQQGPGFVARVNGLLDEGIRRFGGPHLYGALMGQPATGQAPARGGLLSGLAELSPGADIRDLMAGSAQLMQGGAMNALEGVGLMGGAVLGTMVPGSVSGYRQAAEEIAEEVAPAGIRAYHGSPHHFDEFSMEHIGTGEGAQAYGHGLYFAENERVARDYRDALTDPEMIPLFIDGQPLDTVWNDELRQRFPRMYEGLTESQSEAMDQVLGTLQSVNDIDQANRVAQYSMDSAARRIFQERVAPNLQKPEVGPGAMYEVNIRANPEDFLDWDAPLSEQPEEIRRAFAQAAAGNDPLVQELMDGSPESLQMLGLFPRSSGAQAYNTLSEGAREEFTRRLADQGIPGIRYYDAGSRSAGEGTRNYVVFDDSLIDVIRKYGILAPMVGAGAGLTYGEVEQLEREPPL